MIRRTWWGLLAGIAVLALAGVLVTLGAPIQAHSRERGNPPLGRRRMDQPPHPAPAQAAVPHLSPCPGSWSLQASYPVSVTTHAVATKNRARPYRRASSPAGVLKKAAVRSGAGTCLR